MTSVSLQQGSDLWLSYRQSKVTGTDAYTIMQLNPWKTPFRLWQEKLGLVLPDEPTLAMRRGIELEPIARDLFIETTGIVVKPDVLIAEPPYSFLMCSLDGISEDRKTIVEIKCSQSLYEQACVGLISEMYRCQMQHQYFVSNATKCYYVCYYKKKIEIIEFEKDEEYINRILEKEKEFYNCMQNLESPEKVEEDMFLDMIKGI